MFGLMYRIGFTPWEGHALPVRLRALVDGSAARQPGRALDLGCGTGDTSIYLARHGWDVTGIDFVEAALRKARRKAAAAGVRVRWIRDDVTNVGSHVSPGIRLFADNGCFHALSDDRRAAYVQAVTAAAAADASLVIAAFGENPRRRGPRGVDGSEIERRFAEGWRLVASELDGEVTNNRDDPIYVHELHRTWTRVYFGGATPGNHRKPSSRMCSPVLFPSWQAASHISFAYRSAAGADARRNGRRMVHGCVNTEGSSIVTW
ncbi:MAG: class I SAM-dependent methyltransferase [Acidobacteria bacterium]|nr:class I SAM-dependent methyltransferase [Acidobacteriota bacterium]